MDAVAEALAPAATDAFDVGEAGAKKLGRGGKVRDGQRGRQMHLRISLESSGVGRSRAASPSTERGAWQRGAAFAGCGSWFRGVQARHSLADDRGRHRPPRDDGGRAGALLGGMQPDPRAGSCVAAPSTVDSTSLTIIIETAGSRAPGAGAWRRQHLRWCTRWAAAMSWRSSATAACIILERDLAAGRDLRPPHRARLSRALAEG